MAKIKETLMYSNYETSCQKSSQIDKGAFIRETIGFKCPKCRTNHPELTHGSKMICTNCGLKMQLFGNALNCELEV